MRIVQYDGKTFGLVAHLYEQANDADEVILNDPINKSYKKPVIAENKIKGIVSLFSKIIDSLYSGNLLLEV